MPAKKGRKCSEASFMIFQHTHKSLSFFRFPKDAERCNIWIEKSGRPELVRKHNLYEHRVCEKHFESNMFLNDRRNYLRKNSIPTLRLDRPKQQKIVGTDSVLETGFEPHKWIKTESQEDDLLAIMNPQPPAAYERNKCYIDPENIYLIHQWECNNNNGIHHLSA